MSKNKNKQRGNAVAPEAPKKPTDDQATETGGTEEFEDREDDWDDDAPVIPDPSETDVAVYVAPDGTEVPVVCRNCAMWGTPHAFLGGKAMCYEGKLVNVLINDEDVKRPMAEDIWSCSAYFVPRGLDITAAVPASPGQAAVTLKAAKWLKGSVEMRTKAAGIVKRYQEPLDGWLDRMDALSDTIATPDDYRFVFPLIQLLADSIVKQHRKVRQVGPGRGAGQKFQKGDAVQWTDATTGAKMVGWIMSIALRTNQVTVMLDQKSAAAVKPGTTGSLLVVYDYRLWRGYDPEVTQQTSVVMMTEPAAEGEDA